MPLYRDGNIQEYLQRHPDINIMPLARIFYLIFILCHFQLTVYNGQIIQIAKAVEHLHLNGVAHGNISPVRISLQEISFRANTSSDQHSRRKCWSRCTR